MAKVKIITKGKKRKGGGAAAKRPMGEHVAREIPEPADEVGGLACPIPRDPAMGDKTPGVMAWYREYQPEEFKKRYGSRVCPEVDEVVVRKRSDGVDEEDGPVSDFEDEDDEVVMVKPRVIMQ